MGKDARIERCAVCGDPVGSSSSPLLAPVTCGDPFCIEYTQTAIQGTGSGVAEHPGWQLAMARLNVRYWQERKKKRDAGTLAPIYAQSTLTDPFLDGLIAEFSEAVQRLEKEVGTDPGFEDRRALFRARRA